MKTKYRERKVTCFGSGESGPFAQLDNGDRVYGVVGLAPEMLDMLEAIRARIGGEWDNPALLKWGALHPNAEWDISERIDTILNRINQ